MTNERAGAAPIRPGQEGSLAMADTATTTELRKRLRKDLDGEVKFLRAHLPHMGQVDLAMLAQAIETLRAIHSETRCFADQNGK